MDTGHITALITSLSAVTYFELCLLIINDKIRNLLCYSQFLPHSNSPWVRWHWQGFRGSSLWRGRGLERGFWWYRHWGMLPRNEESKQQQQETEQIPCATEHLPSLSPLSISLKVETNYPSSGWRPPWVLWKVYQIWTSSTLLWRRWNWTSIDIRNVLFTHF